MLTGLSIMQNFFHPETTEPETILTLQYQRFNFNVDQPVNH